MFRQSSSAEGCRYNLGDHNSTSKCIEPAVTACLHRDQQLLPKSQPPHTSHTEDTTFLDADMIQHVNVPFPQYHTTTPSEPHASQLYQNHRTKPGPSISIPETFDNLLDDEIASAIAFRQDNASIPNDRRNIPGWPYHDLLRSITSHTNSTRYYAHPKATSDEAVATFRQYDHTNFAYYLPLKYSIRSTQRAPMTTLLPGCSASCKYLRITPPKSNCSIHSIGSLQAQYLLDTTSTRLLHYRENDYPGW